MGTVRIATLLMLASIALPLQAAENINIMLQEWRIVTDKTTVRTGKVTLAIQNRGRETHEIVLLKTDLPFDQLPLLPEGGIDEAKAGEVIDEIEDVTAFSKHELTAFLKPGKYVLLCNMVEMEDNQLEQHYAMGMRLSLVVK
ncbi:MAG: hypothetical protein OEZ43_00785 [Gammaproteobacteria bacterium]|nr:hypothetical protein [Gammaproteobacteria bacterium]